MLNLLRGDDWIIHSNHELVLCVDEKLITVLTDEMLMSPKQSLVIPILDALHLKGLRNETSQQKMENGCLKKHLVALGALIGPHLAI